MPRALDAVNANCDSNSRRDGLQVPDLCDPDCAAAYLPVFHGCHDLLQSIALQQGQGNERRGAKFMRKFDQLGAACEEAVQNAHQVDEVRVNGATYLITDEQQLEASTELQQIAIPLDYDLGFVLTPGETTVEGWANIIHVTASGNNCCDYGDRIPGIWFYPGTRRLHIRDGSTDNGNEGCDPEEELAPGVPVAVKLEIRATSITVSYDNVEKCSGDRGARLTQSGAHVFASDPWHPAADTTIANFYITCDSDTSTPGLQAEPDEDPIATCAASAGAPPPPAVSAAGSVQGATYLITDPTPLAQGRELSVIDIPPDYDVAFTLTPTAETVEGWANIVHVTASGENCCDYGDRIPGICKC